MIYRTRICYSKKQKEEMWDRWQKGESISSIGRSFDRGSGSISVIFSRTGGIRPAARRRSKLALTLSEREEISRAIACHSSLRAIASSLARSPSTISREINRNGGYDSYRAAQAEQAAWDKALRPKPCKLSYYPVLNHNVARKLKQKWSPEQIAGWLKRKYPGEEYNQVSHETIYRSLFVQTRGVLKKELLQYLRTKRKMRYPKKSGLKNQGLGKIPNTVSIHERPASVEDRAVPGHWEGDLIEGSKNTFIATLVERHSRYVMLAKVKK